MGDKAMTYSNGKMKRAGDTDTVDFDGNVNLGNGDSDNIDFKGEVTSDILPNVTETYNIGSAGKMWAKGYFESIIQRHVKVAYYNYDGTDKRFIRFSSTGVTNSIGGSANSVLVAPANGELLSVKIRTKSASGNTTIGFHKASDGTGLPITSDSGSWSSTDSATVNIVNANSTYTANFSNASFQSGEVLGISVDPTTKTDDTQVTAIFIFDWNA